MGDSVMKKRMLWQSAFVLVHLFSFNQIVTAAGPPQAILDRDSAGQPEVSATAETRRRTVDSSTQASSTDTVSFMSSSALSSADEDPRAKLPAKPIVTSFVPALTNQRTLTLSGTKDANTSVLINSVTAVPRNKYTTWTAIVNLPVEGQNVLSITTKKSLGKPSLPQVISLIRDTVAPAGSIDINSGALYTTSETVTLNLSGTDATSGMNTMTFSTDNINWSTPEAYAPTKSYTLSAGDGTKTFYVKYYDRADNASQVYSRNIIRDTAPPSGSVNINSGAAFVNLRNVTLNLSATDAGSGVDKMSFSADNVNWSAQEAYAATKSYTFSGGDGTKTLYVKYFDKIGNVSAVYSKSTVLDTVAPTGSIDGGFPVYSWSTDWVMKFSATDVGSGIDTMSFSTDGVQWSTPEAFQMSPTIRLPAGDGPKTFSVKFYDKAGNASPVYSDSYILETVAPTGSVVINNGAASTSSPI